MKRAYSTIRLGIILIIASFVFYLLHFAVFRDFHHIMLYLIGDIAFVFIEVLLVTVIIHEMLNLREKQARMEKLNMVIGAFFSEVGSKLLTDFAQHDPNLDRIRQDLTSSSHWSGNEFIGICKRIKDYEYNISTQNIDLSELRDFLVSKRGFLLRLMENPTLLEHEAFTSVLMAAFHLTEELEARTDFINMPETDKRHLAGDIKRVYSILTTQWLDYMNHLKGNYPYLFSLAIRLNPFDRNASPVVKE